MGLRFLFLFLLLKPGLAVPVSVPVVEPLLRLLIAVLLLVFTFGWNLAVFLAFNILRHRPPSPEVSPEPSLLPRLLLFLTSLFFLTLLLVFTLRSQLPPVVPALLVVVGPAVGGVLGTLNR